MKRCQIGTASSQTPAERTGVWIRNNLLRLVAAVIAAAVFCFIVNWCVGGLGNFLASGDVGSANKIYHTDTVIPMTIKIGGCIVIGWLAFFRLGSNSRM